MTALLILMIQSVVLYLDVSDSQGTCTSTAVSQLPCVSQEALGEGVCDMNRVFPKSWEVAP